MKPTKRKAFNFLRSYFDVLNELKEDSDKLDFLMSIINKQFLDEDPKELGFIPKLCYESQRHAIEKSVKGWKTANNTDMEGNPILPLPLPPTLPKGSPLPLPPKEEQEKEEVEEQEKEQLKQNAQTLYDLYPSKTIRNSKQCQTKSKDKNIKKLLILLNDKKHTFESLKNTIEITLKGKDQKNGVYQYLRDFEAFLNNLPDIDESGSNLLDDICKELNTTVDFIEKKANKKKDEIERHVSFLMETRHKQSSRTYESVFEETIRYYYEK